MNVYKTHYRFPSAFTLVELIVVIAVLAILAAISFSTVANITSGARDSARLTDISSMKTSLETYNATKGGYPLPDNPVAISWSGNLAWSQGTFGDNTARALNTISRPKDPKWNVDYTYSVTNSKKEYEIATVLEKATSFNGISKTYAQGEQYDTVIKGNYNGVAIKVSSAISTWILAVPTIIASDIKDAKLENIVFAYPKTGNVPFSYTGSITSPQAVPSPWTVKQVWSGALVLPKTDIELQQLTADLKTTYTGSPAANNEVIKSLLATSDGKTYGSNVVNNVGGSIVNKWGNNMVIPVIPTGVTHYWTLNGATPYKDTIGTNDLVFVDGTTSVDSDGTNLAGRLQANGITLNSSWSMNMFFKKTTSFPSAANDAIAFLWFIPWGDVYIGVGIGCRNWSNGTLEGVMWTAMTSNFVHTGNYDMFTLVYDGSILSLYGNKTLLVSEAKTQPVMTGLFTVGGFNNGLDFSANGANWHVAPGRYKNISLYNRKLSQSEINSFY